MNQTIRIAHLSDLHFSKVSFSPAQFLSKRWVGTFNLLFFRRKSYQTTHLAEIHQLIDSQCVEHICVTGDFSSTSLEEEFRQAKAYLSGFKQHMHFLPGNHDMYTKEAEKSNLYFRYFPSPSLQKMRVEKVSLGKGWWWIALHCAYATPPFFSNGRFFPEMERTLEEALIDIPQKECVIIGNHFPLWAKGASKHGLERADRLQHILQKYRQVKLYLHGHDHMPYIKDQRHPLTLNCGSCAYLPAGSFNILDLSATHCHLKRFAFRNGVWSCILEQTYKWL